LAELSCTVFSCEVLVCGELSCGELACELVSPKADIDINNTLQTCIVFNVIFADVICADIAQSSKYFLETHFNVNDNDYQ
jgi:hypothetical protein